ncbi:helix-turn-helix domain-containing protein [Kitasatospora sp. NPDC058965]|uniref:helix-turn-helix domain-containing protein n=1 Tax=Kitasatospora sp. NPDC058965 TaxID=3346682 RepID=UPI0036798C78
MLEPLGVTAPAEEVYRVVLRYPDRTVAELVGHTRVDAARLRRLLRGLEEKGLVVRTSTRPVRYRPAPPDPAIEVLALALQERVQRARLEAAELGELWRTGQAGHELPARVVRGDRANVHLFEQTQRLAKQEVVILDRPPYVATGLGLQTATQLELMDRGVRFRTVYDRRALDAPGELALARRLTQGGELARVVERLPMKLLIVDGSTALVPFALEGERQTVVLTASPLLDGLVALFEAQWQLGAPLWGPGRPSSELSQQDVELLGFAAAGHTDEVIARKLGVNPRTVERRMRRLMDALGARTRFQAGLQAARRGLLG